MNAAIKSFLRKEKLILRQSLAPGLHAQLSAQAVLRIKSCLGKNCGILALYYPMRNEVDVSPLLKTTYLDICLPAVVPPGHMAFRAYRPGCVETNKYGIPQPREDSPELLPDTVIVPLVAFDRRGFRVGYGGGYYDKALAGLYMQKKIAAIGVAFSFQEVEKVPEEKHDHKLDAIVTENEVIRVQ